MCSSARLSRSDAAPGRADRRRGPSAGSRWRCRAGPGSVAGVVFKWRTRDRSPRRKRRAALAARSGALRYPPIHGAEARGDPRRPVRPAMVGGQVGVRDVDGRGGCGGSPKTPAARYGHTGQPRKAPDGLRRDFTPDAAAGRALVPGSHRNPHRRRQTPSRDSAGSVFAALRPIPDTGWCTVSSPCSAWNASAGHPSVSLRIQWLNDALLVHLVGAHERVCATSTLI